jgi:RNA polymerase sigma factor (sigma-70 family)
MNSPVSRRVSDAELADLCHRAASADEEAVQQLLLHYHARLLGFCRRKVGVDWQGKIDPEDLLQEGYIKVFATIKDFQPDGEDSFYRWATRILDHTFIDHVRALRRQKRDIMRETASGQANSARRNSLLDRVLRDSMTPSRIIRRDDALAALMACIAKLPEVYRVVVKRHFLEEQTYKTIAAELDRSEDAVRRLAHRAVEQLARCMGSASQYFSMHGTV